MLKVQQVIVHPRYEEASSSGFDIAVYKVKYNNQYKKSPDIVAFLFQVNDAPLVGKVCINSVYNISIYSAHLNFILPR